MDIYMDLAIRFILYTRSRRCACYPCEHKRKTNRAEVKRKQFEYSSHPMHTIVSPKIRSKIFIRLKISDGNLLKIANCSILHTQKDWNFVNCALVISFHLLLLTVFFCIGLWCVRANIDFIKSFETSVRMNVNNF